MSLCCAHIVKRSHTTCVCQLCLIVASRTGTTRPGLWLATHSSPTSRKRSIRHSRASHRSRARYLTRGRTDGLSTKTVDGRWITPLRAPQARRARSLCTRLLQNRSAFVGRQSYPIRGPSPTWNAVALTPIRDEFKACYNAHFVHRSFDGETPVKRAGAPAPAQLAFYGWKQHCRELFETPIAG